MDNIYRLRVFLHLCKTLNFTESGRQLHLAQPAISRHIKQLEEEVGSNLGSSLSVLTLFEDYPVFVGRAERKKVDLDKETLSILVYHDDDYYSSEFIEKHFNKNQRKNIKIIGSINSHESMLNWILELDAFAIVPFSSFNQFQYKAKLKVFRSESKSMTLDLVYVKNSTSELRKRIFLDEMKKVNSQ